MAKMTAKYSSALEAARRAKIRASNSSNQEELYTALQQAGYFWDSGLKKWEYHKPELADDPTPLVMVRVWAAADQVEAAARRVAARLSPWQLVEQSPPYPCRPPKQKEARVYLKFLRENRVWCDVCGDWIPRNELRCWSEDDRRHYLCPGCGGDLLPSVSIDDEE